MNANRSRHFKPCIVIPFYNHEGRHRADDCLGQSAGLPCWLVDDGSGERCAAVLNALAARGGWLHLIRYRPNYGKGQAVMIGCAAARHADPTHALQLDAMASADVDDLLAAGACAGHPQPLVASSVYDDSVPRGRSTGTSRFWVWVNTLSFQIRIPCADSGLRRRLGHLEPRQCQAHGFRYRDHGAHVLGRHPVLSVPTQVTYPVDGVSHFNMTVQSPVRMHARLFFGMLIRLPRLLGGTGPAGAA